MVGTGPGEVACAMWPAAVVVGGVPGNDVPQVSFAEDQDAVGEFGSGGQDEAFGVAVRPGTSWWTVPDLVDNPGRRLPLIAAEASRGDTPELHPGVQGPGR